MAQNTQSAEQPQILFDPSFTFSKKSKAAQASANEKITLAQFVELIKTSGKRRTDNAYENIKKYARPYVEIGHEAHTANVPILKNLFPEHAEFIDGYHKYFQTFTQIRDRAFRDYLGENSNEYAEFKKRLEPHKERLNAFKEKLDPPKTRQDAIKKNLWWMQCSGVQEKGHGGDGMKPNGCFQIDWDNKRLGGDLEARTFIASILANLAPYIVVVCESPSGYGVKMLVSTDVPGAEMTPGIWKGAQKQVIKDLTERYGIDPRMFDDLSFAQTCDIPYDPNVYANFNPVPFAVDRSIIPVEADAPKERRAPGPGAFQSVSGDITENAARHLIENGINVTEDRDDYVKVIFACRHAFGKERGEEIARELCSMSDKFKEKEFKADVRSWKPNHHKPVTGAYLIELAKAEGFNPYPARREAEKLILRAKYGDKLTPILEAANVPFTPEFWNYKILIAPTGTGKTHAVNDFANKTGERVVILCPNTFMVVQNAKYGFVPCKEGSDPAALRGAQKIACTYQSFAKLCAVLDIEARDFCVFLDESHNLTTGTSGTYLLKPLSNIVRILEDFPFRSVTLLTATPIFNFHKYFAGFETIKIEIERPPIPYTLTHCKNIISAAVALALQSIKAGRFAAIWINDKGAKLTAIKTLLDKQGIIYAVVNRDEKGETNFNEIVKNGTIPADVQALIFTSALKEGNDILNPYDFDFIIAEQRAGTPEFRQTVGRARNGSVKMHILKGEAKADRKPYNFDIWETENTERRRALFDCEDMNRAQPTRAGAELAAKVRRGIQNVAIKVTDAGLFEVDELRLNNIIYQEMAEAERHNDGYQIKNLEALGFALESSGESDAEQSEEEKAEIKEIVKAQKETTAAAYAETLNKISTSLTAKKEVEKCRYSKERGERSAAERVTELTKDYELSEAQSADLLKPIEKDSDYRRFKRRARAKKHLEEGSKNMRVTKHLTGMLKAFEIGRKYTGEEIKERVLQAIEVLPVNRWKFEKKRNTGILEELRTVYDVKPITTRNGEEVEKLYLISKIDDCNLTALYKILDQRKVTNPVHITPDATGSLAPPDDPIPF